MKKIITVIILFVALFQSSSLMAQDILKGNDLSTVKVDYLSDGDIAKLKGQLQNNNVTIDQAESMALSKGMSAEEFAKLKKRLAMPETAKKAEIDKKTTKKKSKDVDSEEEQD